VLDAKEDRTTFRAAAGGTVVPLLVNVDDVCQVQGRTGQLQAIKVNEDGMGHLCRSIAAVISVDPLTIDSRFEWAQPNLEKAIERCRETVAVSSSILCIFQTS